MWSRSALLVAGPRPPGSGAETLDGHRETNLATASRGVVSLRHLDRRGDASATSRIGWL